MNTLSKLGLFSVHLFPQIGWFLSFLHYANYILSDLLYLLAITTTAGLINYHIIIEWKS